MPPISVDWRVVAWHGLAEMPNNPQIPPRRILFLAFPDVQLLDITGPLQVFASANRLTEQTHYETSVVSAAGGPIASSAGLALVTDRQQPNATTVDTVIIPGGPGVDAAALDLSLQSWITDAAGRARRTASVCTGAFLLAATGMLRGRRATTH